MALGASKGKEVVVTQKGFFMTLKNIAGQSDSVMVKGSAASLMVPGSTLDEEKKNPSGTWSPIQKRQ